MARRASRAAQGRALALLAFAACSGGGTPSGGVVTVTMSLPPKSAAEAEVQLLTPMEAALGGVKDVYGIRGRAFEGGATVDVTFAKGVDALTATHAVHEAITATIAQLPSEMDVPSVQVHSPASVLARIGDQPDAYQALRVQLERLPVAGVDACGVREARLLLELVPTKMMAMGVTFQDVVTALDAVNVDIPAGRITTGTGDPTDTTIRVTGASTTQDAIADTVIRAGDQGVAVRVRDLAVITQRSEAVCLVRGATDPKAPALLRVALRSPRDRARIVKELKKRRLAVLDGAATFTAPGRPHEVTLVTAPVGPVVEAVLVGDDAEALADTGRTALAALRANTAVAAAWCQGCERDTAEELALDRDAAARHGVALWQAASALRAVVAGEPVSTFTVGDTRGEVVLGIEEGGTRWAQLPIDTDDRNGRMVTLADVVRVTQADAPRDLLHIDRRRAVAVYVRGGAKTSASALSAAVNAVLPGTRVRTVPSGSLDADSW